MNHDEREKNRLYAVERYKDLELKQDENLQEITHLAAYVFQAPIALVTLMDKDVQWVIAKKGTEAEQLSRETSFCTYAIEDEGPMVVPDAKLDVRFTDSPVVINEPGLRFYAGAPLKSSDGFNVGTLCVFDNKPRIISEDQLDCLQALTNQVTRLLELKLTFKALSDSIEELSKQNELLRKIAQIQSHELREPVSAIMGVMNVIKYEDYNPDKEYLLMLEGLIGKMDKKIRRIVSLASDNNNGFNDVCFPVVTAN